MHFKIYKQVFILKKLSDYTTQNTEKLRIQNKNEILRNIKAIVPHRSIAYIVKLSTKQDSMLRFKYFKGIVKWTRNKYNSVRRVL